MATSKLHLTLLDQAETPLQTMILLAQLQMLRKLESRRGSAEATLVIFMLMAAAIAFLIGVTLAQLSPIGEALSQIAL